MKRSREEWVELVDEWKRSGASVEAFAEPLGIRPKTLLWWMWRLGARRARSKSSRVDEVRMLPVTVRAPVVERPEARVIEVEIGSTIVRFPAATDPQTIGDVMLEIKALTC